MLALLSLLAPFGCETVCTVGDPVVETPEAWTGLTDTAEADTLDEAVLSSDLQGQFESLLWIQAGDAHTAFLAAMSNKGGSCPAIAETVSDQYGTSDYFDGLCYSGDMVYKGPSTAFYWNDQQILAESALWQAARLPSELKWTGMGYNGQTDIYSLDGTLDFNCSCTMIAATAFSDEGYEYYFGETQGTAHWTGDESTGTWLQLSSIVPDFVLVTIEAGTRHQAEFSGTLSGVGERYNAVIFEIRLTGDSVSGEWTCGEDSYITVSFRDNADGSWHDIEMHADDTCTVCGTTEGYEGVCWDAKPLVNWEHTPW